MEVHQMSDHRKMDIEARLHIHNWMLISFIEELTHGVCNYWIQIKGIVLSKVSQRETNTVWFCSAVEYRVKSRWLEKTKQW